MKERQEWMKQALKEFEEKMDAKFNRKEKADNHPVHHGTDNHEVTLNKDNPSSPIQGQSTRMLKILVNSGDGDKVRINVPLKIGKTILMKGSKLSGRWVNALDEQDADMIMEMIDQGHIGEIVNVESADGDTVIIKVE
ncbi:MAG: hypothetical protein ACLFUQ_02580 [Candidatus Izemoplasmataceae bacterium]